MIVLSLDISSKTGWAVLNFTTEPVLLSFGRLAKTSEPEGKYPENYLQWAKTTADDIIRKIKDTKPDTIVIEETSKGSKNAKSQKILEWVHFMVATYIVENGLNAEYLMTGEWRGLVSASMTKDEKKQNKEVKKSHDAGQKVVKNEKGKRIGRVTKKHVNIRRANEMFGLALKRSNEDEADAILLGAALFRKKQDISEKR